ncbi:hypothetical protein V6O07_07570, partial [Arthrospira platensis SPKY2]
MPGINTWPMRVDRSSWATQSRGSFDAVSGAVLGATDGAVTWAIEVVPGSVVTVTGLTLSMI